MKTILNLLGDGALSMEVRPPLSTAQHLELIELVKQVSAREVMRKLVMDWANHEGTCVTFDEGTLPKT